MEDVASPFHRSHMYITTDTTVYPSPSLSTSAPDTKKRKRADDGSDGVRPTGNDTSNARFPSLVLANQHVKKVRSTLCRVNVHQRGHTGCEGPGPGEAGMRGPDRTMRESTFLGFFTLYKAGSACGSSRIWWSCGSAWLCQSKPLSAARSMLALTKGIVRIEEYVCTTIEACQLSDLDPSVKWRQFWWVLPLSSTA